MTDCFGPYEIRLLTQNIICVLPQGENENVALSPVESWSYVAFNPSSLAQECFVLIQCCNFVRGLPLINSWGHIWYHKFVAMAQQMELSSTCREKKWVIAKIYSHKVGSWFLFCIIPTLCQSHVSISVCGATVWGYLTGPWFSSFGKFYLCNEDRAIEVLYLGPHQQEIKITIALKRFI